MLAAVLATLALGAPPAVADAGATRTFASGELCKTAGEVTYDAGAIRIDIGKLAPDVTDVVIATGALSGCLADVISLHWTGVHQLNKLTIGQSAFSQNNMPGTLTSVSFPAGLTSLEIGNTAFYQQAADGSTAPKGPNTLASVDFPAGLSSLTIGNSAFFQYATLGPNALSSVTFPASLTSLVIGEFAFAQQAYDGANSLQTVKIQGLMSSLSVGAYAFQQFSPTSNNALSSVSFPASVDTLTLGTYAFGQSAPVGTPALASIAFPSGLTTLAVGDRAFWQYTSGQATLRAVRFPGSLRSLSIGLQAFQQTGTPNTINVILERADQWPAQPAHTLDINPSAFSYAPEWYWFGADATSLASAWNGTIVAGSPNPNLRGYRKLSFDTAGGTGPTEWYVYPVTRGIGHADQPQVLDHVLLGTNWSVDLPSATRDGYQLDGWCSGPTSPCSPANLTAVGDSYSLTTASQTVHASWQLSVPKVVSSVPAATVGTPYQAVVSTGAELACSATGLPAGLSLSGCRIVGTPSAAGSFPVTVKASNSAGESSGSLALVVRHAAPSITTIALPSGKVTVPYSQAISVKGEGTITCAVISGSLPSGLALRGCRLVGTPTQAASYRFTVSARNDGGAGQRTFTVSVASAKKFTKVYKPKISGKAKVGKTLKAKMKTWKPKPSKLSWQWYRGGVKIVGATKASYKVTRADKGKKLKVQVMGIKVGYQSSATSKNTVKVK